MNILQQSALWAMSAVLLITGVSQAAVLQDAISWAYDKGLTSFNTDTSFMPNNNLRRDEASKFLVEFAELVGMNTDDMLRNCSFSDVEKSRPDLKGYVATSCQYNILKGNNGEFWPDQSLTNAQIVTAVVRILDNGGLQSESWVTHWADNYYSRAQNLWLDLTKFWSKDTPATRGNVIMFLYDAASGTASSSSDDEMDAILQQLIDIIEG